MKKVYGDLIELAKNGEFDVIVHGCNCFCKMGNGIAKQIKDCFPEAYYIDCSTDIADKGKLGNYTSVSIQHKLNKFTIVNAYTQYYYGGGRNVDYNAIENVFDLIRDDFRGARFGIPMIGAGLAGGDWNIIYRIIDDKMRYQDLTLVLLK